MDGQGTCNIFLIQYLLKRSAVCFREATYIFQSSTKFSQNGKAEDLNLSVRKY